MKIGIVTPAPPKSRYGNRVTALRWARILRKLGHSVTIKQEYDGEPLDLLIALHARRSYVSIKSFHREHPDRPLIVALTGTDLYRDLTRSKRAQQSLDFATRIVVLQPKAFEDLSARSKEKARVIYQSVSQFVSKSVSKPGDGARNRTALIHSPDDASRFVRGGTNKFVTTREALSSRRTFDVCVIGHLRPVKDPFRAAMAARLLPSSSRVRIVQVGGAMSEREATRARAEMKLNARYQWLGEQPAWRVRQILKQSRICVLSSKMEGGANALGEAIVAGTPILSSRIPGSVGILGEDYPGYFQVGNTGELARLMFQAETDPEFFEKLRVNCKELLPLFDPAREEAAWVKLLDELFERRPRLGTMHHASRAGVDQTANCNSNRSTLGSWSCSG
jgi:glycosyltransferase involved in cell wall biosynthesis